MNKIIYDIQIKSVRSALAHLHALDLKELNECARIHGTEQDRKVLTTLIRCLPDLPGEHH